MIQDKAQFAVDGCSLNKDGNTVLRHSWASLRAQREGITCFVAPLGKDQAFPARRALQLTASGHAESAMNQDAVHLQPGDSIRFCLIVRE